MMLRAKAIIPVLLGVLALAMRALGFPSEPDADGAREIGLKYFSPRGASLENLSSRGLEPTGLRPIYPTGADCSRASSFFADSTRGDGSPRSPRFFHGYHGGLDIPAAEGTPILAIADGVVVAKSMGRDDGIGGIEIVL